MSARRPARLAPPVQLAQPLLPLPLPALQWAAPAPPVRVVQQAPVVLSVHRAPQAHRVQWELLVRLVPRAPLVLRAQLAPVVPRVPPVQLEPVLGLVLAPEPALEPVAAR